MTTPKTGRGFLASLAQWHPAIQLLATIITAGATVLLWWVTCDYIAITENIYEAQQAPLVLIFVATVRDDVRNRMLRVDITAQNYGQGVAYENIATCHNFMNGSEVPAGRTTDKPMILAPKAKATILWGAIGEPEYSALLAGMMSMEVSCDTDFQDFAKHVMHSHARFRFMPSPGNGIAPRLSNIEGWCHDDSGGDCGQRK